MAFFSGGSWLNACMKKEDRPLTGKDVYSFVSTQKKEQSGGWCEMTSMKKKHTYPHIHVHTCMHMHRVFICS